MEVKVAKTAGFCWGVRRTVDQLMEVARERQAPVVTLGPIIHNPQFVARTREMGVGTVESVSDVTPGTTVVVRTHGAVKPELDTARERGLEVVDGTCPYVKYPQAMAQRLSQQGYHVVIVGDPGHAEVKGVVFVSLQKGAAAAQAARQAGKLSASLMRFIDELIAPQLPWRTLLARIMAVTWSRLVIMAIPLWLGCSGPLNAALAAGDEGRHARVADEGDPRDAGGGLRGDRGPSEPLGVGAHVDVHQRGLAVGAMSVALIGTGVALLHVGRVLPHL